MSRATASRRPGAPRSADGAGPCGGPSAGAGRSATADGARAAMPSEPGRPAGRRRSAGRAPRRAGSPAPPSVTAAKTRQRRPFDRRRQQLLDVVQQRALAVGGQRDRLTRQPRPAGAADAVDVVLRHQRQVEVDHQRQLLDVEAAGRHVGGDQHGDAPRLEVAEGPLAGALRLVAVDDRGAQAGAPRGGGRRGPSRAWCGRTPAPGGTAPPVSNVGQQVALLLLRRRRTRGARRWRPRPPSGRRRCAPDRG